MPLQSKRDYNDGMSGSRFDEMKRFVRFSDADAINVRSLRDAIAPRIIEIIDHFYEQVFRHTGARAVFVGGDEQLANVRRMMAQWLDELLQGTYDDAYYFARLKIGRTHVRIGLSQHYTLLGMDLIRQELDRLVCESSVDDPQQKLASLNKLLALELTVMLESYKESYSEQIREAERSAVEERLTRAEHLAEIGQLAASLAHEIKNPLAGISGAIQIIRDSLPDDAPHRPIITEILGQIARLDATVKDLLLYARPTPPKPTPVAVAQMVKRLLTLLGEEPSLQRVRIDHDGATSSPAVIDADGGQIEQLLMNLLINAAHASQDGGVIRISVLRDNESVRLIVQDWGKGMSPQVRDRAFEPFFTTKARGSGLGLSICRRIAETNGADMKIESVSDQGTTVTIIFPLPQSQESQEVDE